MGACSLQRFTGHGTRVNAKTSGEEAREGGPEHTALPPWSLRHGAGASFPAYCAQHAGPVTPVTTALHSPLSRGGGDDQRIKIRVMDNIKQRRRERRGAALGGGGRREAPR